MELVNNFLRGLKSALSSEDLDELNKVHGASKLELDLLKQTYPNCPQSLISLLENIDGTYYRNYGEHEVLVCILGSDFAEGSYPYYLLSTNEMLESSKKQIDVSYLLDAQDEDNYVDTKINPKGLTPGTYIHFSDCMNNGGTSQLYIDFNPSSEGVCGQVIRYLHDPDQYVVIANSFDEYLQMLINNNFIFLDPEYL